MLWVSMKVRLSTSDQRLELGDATIIGTTRSLGRQHKPIKSVFMCRQSEDANASQLKSIPSFPLLIIKLMEVDGSFRWLTGCYNDGAVSCIIHYLLIMR